jgi:hypothetical protein
MPFASIIVLSVKPWIAITKLVRVPYARKNTGKNNWKWLSFPPSNISGSEEVVILKIQAGKHMTDWRQIKKAK